MDRPDFARIIRLVNAAWPSTLGWPAAQWDTWYEELARYPVALVELVIRDATESDFPPNPFKIAAGCSERVRRRNLNRMLRERAAEW